MPHKQRGHQCLCGSTPLLRASSYIARLFLSGRTKKKKKKEKLLSENSSPLQNICHLWESLFPFSHPNSSCERGEMRGGMDLYESVTGSSLTFFYCVILSSFCNAVRVLQRALLGLFSLLVGRFH